MTVTDAESVRLAATSHKLLRLEFLRQPDDVRAETRERAQRLARDGSALARELRLGLHGRELPGERAELEAWAGSREVQL